VLLSIADSLSLKVNCRKKVHVRELNKYDVEEDNEEAPERLELVEVVDIVYDVLGVEGHDTHNRDESEGNRSELFDLAAPEVVRCEANYQKDQREVQQ